MVLYVFPLIGILGLIIPTILGMPNYSVIGIYLAFPLIIGPILINVYLKHDRVENNIESKNIYFTIYSIIFFNLFSICIIILYNNIIRSDIFYLVVSVMASIIFSQAISLKVQKRNLYIVLSEIALLSLLIIFSENINYYYFIGRTDPLVHISLITDILNSGSISQNFGIYQPFPLWHILVSSEQMIIGIDIPVRYTMFITGGVVVVFYIIAAYYLTRKITGNVKIALLACLLLSIFPDSIIYGMSSIPRTVTPFFMILILILLVGNKNPQKLMLALFLVLAVVMYHTVSIPYMIIIFILLIIFYKSESTEKELVMNYRFVILAGVITAAYWVYSAQDLFSAVVRDTFVFVPSKIIGKALLANPYTELFNYIEYSFYLLLMIIGLFYALSKRNSNSILRGICISAILAVPLVFPGPTLLIGQGSYETFIMRFGEYFTYFIVFASAVGLFVLVTKSKRRRVYLVTGLFFLLCLTSISNDFVSSDNPLVQRTFYTTYLSQDEIQGLFTATNISTGLVISDYASFRYLQNTEGYNSTQIIEIDSKITTIMRNNTSDLILIRDGELASRGNLQIYLSKGMTYESQLKSNSNLNYVNTTTIHNLVIDLNKIYSSSAISIHY